VHSIALELAVERAVGKAAEHFAELALDMVELRKVAVLVQRILPVHSCTGRPIADLDFELQKTFN
jgi:hypothetical protein